MSRLNDTFLNWPYPQLRLHVHPLPAEPFRDETPVEIGGQVWATGRHVQQSCIHAQQLAKLTGIKLIEGVTTWEAMVVGHVPMQQNIRYDNDHTPPDQITKNYVSLYGDHDALSKILTDLYGYCPYALDGLMAYGDLRGDVTDLDRVAIVEQAYGPKAAHWYEQHRKAAIPSVSLIGGLLWPKVQYSDNHTRLDAFLFVLSAYKLIANGKLPIKLPPPRVKLYEAESRLYVSYLDEKYESFPLEVKQGMFSAERLRNAYTKTLRTGSEIKKQHGLMTGAADLVFKVAARIEGGVSAHKPEEFMGAFLGRFNEIAEDSGGLLGEGEDFAQLVNLVSEGFREAEVKDGPSMRRFTDTLFADQWKAVLDTRQAWLDGYLELAAFFGKDVETRLKAAQEYHQASKKTAHHIEVFAPHRDKFARAYSSEGFLYLPKHLQPMPAGVGSQWRIRYDQRGRPVQAVANEQLRLQLDDPDYFSLEGHKVTIDLMKTEAPRLLESVNQVFIPTEGTRSAPPAMWIMPKVFSAIMYMYYQMGGMDSKAGIRLQLNDILDFMNVNIDKNNRFRAFGPNYNAHDLVESALIILEHLTYRRDDGDGKAFTQVNGLLKIWREGIDNRGSRWFDVALAPDVQTAMYGLSANMQYMYHNFEAMRAYRQNELQLNPAAQLALETLASIRIRNTGKQTLLTRNDAPWRLETLNNHLGIQKGSESWKRYVAKYRKVLDTQVEHGTLKGYEVEGGWKENSEVYDTRIVLEFSDPLYMANMLARNQKELHAAEDLIYNPIAKKGQAKKRVYQNPDADKPKRPRGRPRKTPPTD